MTRDDEAQGRFIHEAQAAAALEHLNMCDLLEIGEIEDGLLFIAMACYDGETLRRKASGHQLPMHSVIDIPLRIAPSLAKAHEHGIGHRDLKPANIMVIPDGAAKILDLGLAKLAGQTGLTRAGATVDTVACVSPEQAQGEIVELRYPALGRGAV